MRRRVVAAGAVSLLLVGCTFTPHSGIWSLPFLDYGKPWTLLMLAFRVAACLAAAIAVVLSTFLVRRGTTIDRVLMAVSVPIVIMVFGSYFGFFNPNVRYEGYYHRHEFFHTYMSAKYFSEIGYQGLYACSIAAEKEMDPSFDLAAHRIRDLSDNRLKPASQIPLASEPGACRRRFSAARWATFKGDIAFFAERAKGEYWEHMRWDHGFELSPVWILTAMVPAHLLPSGDLQFLTLSMLDVLLQAGMFVLIAWAFGWRTTLVAVVFWACNAISTFYWTGGAFLRQEWLFLLVMAVCLAKRKHGVAAGATFAASCLIQPFLVFLGLGVVASACVQLVRRRRVARAFKRFFAGSVVAVGVLVPASLVATGPGAYREFARIELEQAQRPVTNDVGLRFVLGRSSASRMKNSRDNSLPDPFLPWRQARLRVIGQRAPLLYTMIGLVALWTLWAASRLSTLWAAIPLGIPLLVSALSPVCYLHSFWILVPLAAYRRPVLAAAALLAAASTEILGYSIYYIDDRYVAMTLPLYALGLFMLCAYSWRGRLGRWLSPPSAAPA